MSQLHDSRGAIFNTFALLWCEGCGKAEQPPVRPRIDIAADPYLECEGCGEKLALLECVVRGVHFQERLGRPHRHVATLNSLPDRWGAW